MSGEEPLAPGERLVWILRHAKAEPGPPPGGSDHDRGLRPSGRKDAAALGRRLAEGSIGPAGGAPAVALCSTAVRTTQTAEAALGLIGTVIDRRRRLYYGSPTDLLDEIRTLEDGVVSTMVVGHNPAVYALALALLSADDTGGRAALEEQGFPTCGLAVCRLRAPCWQEVALGTGVLVGCYAPPY